MTDETEKAIEEAKEVITSDIEKKAEEVNMGRTGEGIDVNYDSQESPMEKVERLNKETEDTLKKIQQERKEMEKLYANQMLSGRSRAGEEEKPKTQEQLDQEAANKILESYQGFQTNVPNDIYF